MIVLLYDRSDTLPLSVHLYTSMLAHLHANLNFAIYSLNNRTFRAAYRRFTVRLVARCCHQTLPNNNAAAAGVAAVTHGSRLHARTAGCTRVVEVYIPLVTVECH